MRAQQQRRNGPLGFKVSKQIVFQNDSTVDHLSFANTSISVSPDDNYVVIGGFTNSTFLLMALTNGVPDISTLTTNMVAPGTGTFCYGSGWDAADNICITSGGSDTLRIFSLGLTTTCTTSNDSTFTNGSFKFYRRVRAESAGIQTQPTNQTAQCSGNASFSVTALGPSSPGYQWYHAGGAGHRRARPMPP